MGHKNKTVWRAISRILCSFGAALASHAQDDLHFSLKPLRASGLFRDGNLPDRRGTYAPPAGHPIMLDFAPG